MDKKVAIVTGASKGIGKCLADLLLKEDYIVVNASRSKPDDEKTIFIQTDVTKEEDCKNMVNKVIKDFGRIDILVNNAGVLFPDGIEEMNLKGMKANMETNAYGLVYCVYYASRQMRKQGFGQIVNISSTSGMSFRPGNVSYSMSKWAVVAFSGGIRTKLEEHGIDVICFCPGGTKTEIFRHESDRDISDFMEPEKLAEKIIEAMKRKNKEKWLFAFLRGEKKLREYGFDDYPTK